MSLDCGRQLEYQEKTCKLHTEGGIQQCKALCHRATTTSPNLENSSAKSNFLPLR